MDGAGTDDDDLGIERPQPRDGGGTQLAGFAFLEIRGKLTLAEQNRPRERGPVHGDESRRRTR